MFAATWLHASDGRALYYVAVPIPMPVTVSYAGSAFQWNETRGRYEQRGQALTATGPDVATTVAVELAASDTPKALPEQYPGAIKRGS